MGHVGLDSVQGGQARRRLWPSLPPAWRVTQQSGIGAHLGRDLRGPGKTNKAATVYALAQAALDRTSTPDDRRYITESIDRLEAQGASPDWLTGTQALQDLRTSKIPRPKEPAAGARSGLEVTTAGVIESQQMTGEQTLDSIKPAIGAMKLPEFLPPDSKAHLLLSAVIDCSMGTSCEVVLVPNGGLRTESQ